MNRSEFLIAATIAFEYSLAFTLSATGLSDFRSLPTVSVL